MVSRENFVQLTQARITHRALQATAIERQRYPTGSEATKTAGQKTKAMISKAPVVVYWVPVDFRLGSSIVTSSVIGGGLRKRDQITRLSSDDLRVGGSAQPLTTIS